LGLLLCFFHLYPSSFSFPFQNFFKSFFCKRRFVYFFLPVISPVLFFSGFFSPVAEIFHLLGPGSFLFVFGTFAFVSFVIYF